MVWEQYDQQELQWTSQSTLRIPGFMKPKKNYHLGWTHSSISSANSQCNQKPKIAHEWMCLESSLHKMTIKLGKQDCFLASIFFLTSPTLQVIVNVSSLVNCHSKMVVML